MNREIKFRAFDKEGNDYSDWKPQMIYPENWEEKVQTSGFKFPHPYKSNRYNFMQYTGLKDKTGKEIYEGDIVVISEIKHIVSFYVHAFVFTDLTGVVKIYNLPSPNFIEVIGNIYENLELIKI